LIYGKGRDADASLSQQGNFIKEGGEITRIIEGRPSREMVLGKNETQDETVNAYRRVIEKMGDWGVAVKYVKGFHSDELYDFTWVCLRDAGLPTDIAMLWYASQNSKTIYQCEVSTYKIEDIEIRWYYLDKTYMDQSKSEKSGNLEPTKEMDRAA
jgi:hypothetical protein